MKREMMDILVCPVCKGKLKLTVDKEDGDEIISGSLCCENCGVDYPIEESISNLMPREQKT